MKEINITKGKTVIVDDDDYEKLNKYNWHYTSGGYAARRVTLEFNNHKIKYMHRLVMDYNGGDMVDHINGNKLDNRKSNLRIVDASKNLLNSKVRSDSTSNYKGVSWSKQKQKWRTRLHGSGKELHLGFFDDKHEAARMYNFWAHDLFGEYARLNEIDGKKWEAV